MCSYDPRKWRLKGRKYVPPVRRGACPARVRISRPVRPRCAALEVTGTPLVGVHDNPAVMHDPARQLAHGATRNWTASSPTSA